MSATTKTRILRIDISKGKAENAVDMIAQEIPLHIFFNRMLFVTILCSPLQLRELVVGHLLSEGIVKSPHDIDKIVLKDAQACHVYFKPRINLESRIKLATPFSRIITSACNPQDNWPLPRLIDRLKLPRVASKLHVEAQNILMSVKNLNLAGRVYRQTGGVHVATIHDESGKTLALAEDIGRHNAVDKTIGVAALNDVDLSKCFLAVSGRLTGDMVLKAARTGLPIVASQAAAIHSGVQVAKLCQVTIIGFTRGNRMNIYTYPDRITY